MSMSIHEKLILQTAVVKQLKSIVDTTRAAAEAELEQGDMKRPRGLGSVSLSEPKRHAQVTNDEAFTRHCIETGDANVSVSITGPLEEVLAVLAEHAPHLIGDTHHLPDWLIKRELDYAENGELIPGVTVTEKAPVLRVSTKDAAMVEAAQILAGTPLALEEGNRG